MEVVAVPLDQLDKSKFMFSEKKTKSWNFTDKKTGKQRVGAQTYTEVYYEKPGQKLCFLLEDVRSFNGVQTTDSFKRGFMSVNLKSEKSQLVRQYVDTPIFQLSFQHRASLIKGGTKIQNPSEMRIIYEGIVKTGEEKKDGTGECWDDQLTCNVPMKKKGQQAIVDDNMCTVEDLDGRLYAWSALDGKNLKEVAVEVDKVVFGDKIRINGVYRLIVPEEMARAKVTSRRRMEHKPASKHEGDEGEAEEADPTSTSAAVPTLTPAVISSSSSTKEDRPVKRSRTVPGGS